MKESYRRIIAPIKNAQKFAAPARLSTEVVVLSEQMKRHTHDLNSRTRRTNTHTG